LWDSLTFNPPADPRWAFFASPRPLQLLPAAKPGEEGAKTGAEGVIVALVEQEDPDPALTRAAPADIADQRAALAANDDPVDELRSKR
jgi:hypothetical protein